LSFYIKLQEEFTQSTQEYIEALTDLFLQSKNFIDDTLKVKDQSGIVLFTEEEASVLHNCYHMLEILNRLEDMIEEAAVKAEEKLNSQQAEAEEVMLSGKVPGPEIN
jgi:hypothetical protein